MLTKGIIAIIGLLVVGTIIWQFGSDNKTPVPERISVGPEISAQAQLVGMSATIKSVTLTQPGFVVLREVLDGKLGQIAEVSKYLPTGSYQDLNINLSAAPGDGVEIIATIYNDDGNQNFSTQDDVLANFQGQPVAVSLETGQPVPPTLFVTSESLADIAPENITYVSFTETGYSPANINIKQGDTVVFKNESAGGMWVASDPHPAHTNLTSFDPFKIIPPGGQYQYTFDRVGQWNYHDHISPTLLGSVKVEPVPEDSASNKPALSASGYVDLGVEDFVTLIEKPATTVVNVHIPYGGDIPGTDTSVPFNETEALLAALPTDKTAPIALYCRSGAMSAVAAKALVAAGYTNVYDLSGGMNAYEASGRTLIKINS